jgi:hypothetical protein
MDSLLVTIGSETAFPEAESAVESLRRQLDLQIAFFRSSRGSLIRSLVGEGSLIRSLQVRFEIAGLSLDEKRFAKGWMRP